MLDVALIGFVFFGLFSPGPNVILLTASGARFGFSRTVPHILGVALGVGITAGLTGLGLGTLIGRYPVLELVLKIAASLWILFMAYKLWVASPTETKEGDRPFTFVEAILFQWINPKVWAVAFSAAAYVQDQPATTQGITLALTFSTLNLGVCTFWTTTGHLLRRLVSDPVLWRIFMRCMAMALILFSALIFL